MRRREGKHVHDFCTDYKMILLNWWITLLTLTVIHLTSSITVDIPNPTYEFARGDNATIPCNFIPIKTPNPSIIITWSAHPDNPDDTDIEILKYYYYASAVPELDISSDFTGRASFQLDVAKGSAALTLQSLTSEDTRVFQCDVKIPGDNKGKHSDTTSVVVLVAPSKPICTIQGKAEFYQNINLTCRSEEGMPTPTYKWQSYDVRNNPRPNPPKSTDVNGLLSLYNISTDTSGYYICTSANKIRSDACSLTLAVMPLLFCSSVSMNIGSTAAIVGGCAASLVLLVINICCCCHHRRKKDKAEEYTMVEYTIGSPENGEYRDKETQELEEYQEKRVESKADRSGVSFTTVAYTQNGT